MFRLLLKLWRRLSTREVVHFIPLGLELSDGDHAALYGWPDLYVQEVSNE